MGSIQTHARVITQRSVLQREWAERVPEGWNAPASDPGTTFAEVGASSPDDERRRARERERRIFSRHVLQGESFVAIARDLRISPQRVAQIARRAAERLAAQHTSSAAHP